MYPAEEAALTVNPKQIGVEEKSLGAKDIGGCL